MPMLYSRQTSLSACVAGCMTSGDLGGCSSILEYACICRSAEYQSSVATCWETCDPAEVEIGQMFSQQRCAAVGVTISTSAIVASGTGTGASPTSSSVASSTSVVVTGTPISWEQPPVLYEQTLVNIQAIMSSICAALFILAIVLGVVSCRNRIKRERGQTSSQWSGAGTFGDQTKHDPTSSRFTAAGSRAHLTSRLNSVGQTDTFMSGLSDYRQTVSFSTPMAGVGVGGDRPRFTNRMAVEEEDEQEEWEMKDRKSDGLEEEVKTPTTATSSHHHEDEDRMGSTVALNQVNVLDKGRAI